MGNEVRATRHLRFRSVDDLATLCKDLEAQGYGKAIISLGNYQFHAGPDGSHFQAAMDAAHQSRGFRSNLQVTVQRVSEDGAISSSLWITFSTNRSVPPRIGAQSVDEPAIRQVQYLVDSATTPYTRRELRRNKPVVDPITLDTDVQNEHDAEVSARGARVGGVFGAIAGGLISGLISVVAAIVAK
ncbi:hypothetical protein [Cellulomonas sp. RIT-PI-Y]|uniref:hypothetical protein n=1 Tax=Cellulomonas sp. RIT-PI-Y TaxID=3035297 RepID=UPI0021DA9B3A|nr:hypothetical protein [Cellulomonas sp. RIT-PI-Y]